MERTLIILKPDALQRRLIGRIIQRFEEKGLAIVGLKLVSISRDLAGRHYAAHKDKPFFPRLIEYITSGPVIVMALQGPRAIEMARMLMGATASFEASPGTIRGDFGADQTFNLVHGSDSPEAARNEIALFFAEDELLDYSPAGSEWVFESGKT